MGVDVQPSGDALNGSYNTTTPVYAYTEKYDSFAIINDRYKYLGFNNDPYFGTNDVGLYVVPNISNGETQLSFGDDAQLTSSEIILTVYNLGSSFSGDSAANVNYSVFPVVRDIDPTVVYYSDNDHFHSTHALLGSFTGRYTNFLGRLVLRIPINPDYARAILNNPQYLVDNTTFQSTYKGFYIKCGITSGQGIVTQFDLEDDVSGFYLYYQNGNPSATKNDKSYKFLFGGANPIRFNTMKQDFQTANTLLQQQVLNHDTTKGDNNLFLKGMGVTKARVYIPNIKSYSDSFVVAVNRAEVVFNLDPSVSLTGYNPPPKMVLLPTDSVGREIYALDEMNVTDAARYDGTYDVDNKRYVFNIARHVQAILLGKRKNCGFVLAVANADNLLTYNPVYNGSSKDLFLVRRDNYVERVVLMGRASVSLKPVLNLSYIAFRHD